MASARTERLGRLVTTLQATILSYDRINPNSRKSINYEKERTLCHDIKEYVVSIDFNSTIREDKNYADAIAQAVAVFFSLSNHTEQNLRSLAEECLDTIFRSLLLGFNHNKVVVLLITEINRGGPARSTVGAYVRLAQLVKYTKINKLMSYGLCIVGAMTSLVKRPEDIIQQALMVHTPTIFSVIGPKLRDHKKDKAMELYRAATENMDLSGTANRACVVVIGQCALYNRNVFQRVFVRCVGTLRSPDDESQRPRLVATLNTLKTIWPQIVEEEDLFQDDNLKMLVCCVLCCAQSHHSEVVVATLELLEKMMNAPLRCLSHLYPIEYSMRMVVESRLLLDRSTINSPYTARSNLSERASTLTSPMDPLMDLETSEGFSSMNAPLQFPLIDDDQETIDYAETPDGVCFHNQIIDPLMQPDLYEEQEKERQPSSGPATPSESPIPPDTVGIPSQLTGETVPNTLNAFQFTAALVGRRFLLAGLKGLKNDREVRISHKILALNCIAAAVRNKKTCIGEIKIIFRDCAQQLSEIYRLVFHDDDQLCVAVLGVLSASDINRASCAEHHDIYLRVCNSFQPIRKKAFISMFCGQYNILNNEGLLEHVLSKITTEWNNASFDLLKVTCAEFLSSIEWANLPRKFRSVWQFRCLTAYINLIFGDDSKVAKQAAQFLPRFVENLVLADSSVGQILLSKTYETFPCPFNSIPAVLNMSNDYRFRKEPWMPYIDDNLELIISELLISNDHDISKYNTGLVYALESLIIAFPPVLYKKGWGCNPKVGVFCHKSLLDGLLEMTSTSGFVASQLASVLHVVAALFAGTCESELVDALNSSSVERSSLPQLPNEQFLVLLLRILNLYYSLKAERQSSVSQTGVSILARPSLSAASKKPLQTRIADISRLVGTTVHPHKASSFLDSLLLTQISPSLQGAFITYLESVNPEVVEKFVSLLKAAISALSVVCEMLTYAQIRPLLEEILLYNKVLFDLCPTEFTRLAHQLFKIVFGKNAANLNFDELKTRRRLNSNNSACDFPVFFATLSDKMVLRSAIHDQLGWLRAENLVKVHAPTASEMERCLGLFEGLVTTFVSVFGAYHSLQAKRAILNVMCELPRGGVIYSLVDPKRVLFETVMLQSIDPTAGHQELLSETMLYLHVMHRFSVCKPQRVVNLCAELLDRITQFNAVFVLDAVRCCIFDCAFVLQQDMALVYRTFTKKMDLLIRFAPNETLYLWILFLHASRDDDNEWHSMSIEFDKAYSKLLEDDTHASKIDSTLALIAFSCLSEAIFRPADIPLRILEHSTTKENVSKRLYYVPLLLTLLRVSQEDKLLMRIYAVYGNNTWLSQFVTELVCDSMRQTLGDRTSSGYFELLVLGLTELAKTDDYTCLFREMSLRMEGMSTEYLSPYHLVIIDQFRKLLKQGFARGYQTPENKYPLGDIQSDTKIPCIKQLMFYKIDCDTADVLEVSFQVLPFDPDSFKILLKSRSTDLVLKSIESTSNRKEFICGLSSALEKELRAIECTSDREKVLLFVQEVVDLLDDLTQIENGASGERCETRLVFLKSCAHLARRFDVEAPCNSAAELKDLLRFVESRMVKAKIRRDVGELLESMASVLQQTGVREHFDHRPLDHVHVICSILGHIVRLTRAKESNNTHQSNLTELLSIEGLETIEDVSVQGELDPLIRQLFSDIHTVCILFKNDPKLIDCPEEQIVRSLCRLSLFYSIATVSLAAMQMNWQVRIIFRGPSDFHIPLVNIHLLCNLVVLEDFIWRINWLGWLTRHQFEAFWMSLFGVLSSTPTGHEIDTDDSAERILSSSYAIEGLTSLLLHSMLYPEPGNVLSGHFIVKHREKTSPFYRTSDFEQLSMLRSRFSTESGLPSHYQRNLERLHHKNTEYTLSHLSALSLWNITGDLSPEKGFAAKLIIQGGRMRSSMSEYLMKTVGELDTSSSVRALFDNYSHWLGRGIDNLPLPLLSSTVRSMTLLSDLFDELSMYEFLYLQMRNVFRGGQMADLSDLGYVIYSLLKSMTVIGLGNLEKNTTEGDMAKQVLSWVEQGLSSRFVFAKEATLHGVNYMLQAMSLDALKPVLQTVTSFLIEELSDQNTNVHRLSRELDTVSTLYNDLVWSLVFRIMEEPMQVTFKNTFSQRLCETYWNGLSPSSMEVVTQGIEMLLLHSVVYTQQFLAVVHKCLQEYLVVPATFPFVLRILLACVFRDDSEMNMSSRKQKFKPVFDELIQVYRGCELRDATLVAQVLPSMLLRLGQSKEAAETLLSLCLPLRHNAHNITTSLLMFHELCTSIRKGDKRQEMKMLVDTTLVRIKAASDEDMAIATCILMSLSSDVAISSRFCWYIKELGNQTVTMEEWKRVGDLLRKRIESDGGLYKQYFRSEFV